MTAGMGEYSMKPYNEKRVREIIYLCREKDEKVYRGSKSDRNEIALTSVFSRKKTLRNGIFARSASLPTIANSRVVSPGSDSDLSRF
jgi:hypothetical protein